MSKRTYLLREYRSDGYFEVEIKESELKWRLLKMFEFFKLGYSWTPLFSLLIHGTEKEKPVIVSHEQFQAVQQAMPTQEQGWEQWVRKMPYLTLHLDPLKEITIEDYDKWIKWLLAIPCRKCGRREGDDVK